MNILVVDDNECNRYQLEVLLSGNGYHVVTAAHGVEALDKARRSPPDLVIADVLMPVMDGFSLCREWKRDQSLKAIPFVFYTATYTDERDREFALSLGAERFIVKPEEPDVFVRSIWEVIRQAEHAASAPQLPPPAGPRRVPIEAEEKEAGYLRQYNEVLVHKLEDKLVQLEHVRRELEHEVAERRQSEEAFRRGEERLQLALDAAHLGTWDWDIGTGRILWSEHHAELFGLKKDEFGGSYADFERCVYPEDRAGIATALAVARDQHTVYHHEFRVVWPDGSVHWLMDLGRFFYDAGGQPVRMNGVVQDITEQKDAEAERRQLELQIQQAQKLESLGLLAGGIAHDFNNLLTAILAHAGLAVGDLPPESPVRDNLLQIEKVSHRASDLCRQLLAYAGRVELQIEPLNLSELVAELLPLLKVSISKKVALDCHFPEHLPSVEGDPTQLRQVVMNLVINASEAIGSNEGVIAITTGEQHCDEAYLRELRRVGTTGPGIYVFLEVTDNGCGMDAETQARIFDPFFTTKFTGRGLGLAAVLGIAQSHRCAIKVQSERGKGTTFRLLFPPSSKMVARVEARAPSEQWRGSGTVLVVDDEEPVRDAAAMLVERLGFRAVKAADGREAVELFKKCAEQIACVLLDVTMPRMGGEEVARELQRLRPEVPILLTSGYTEQEITPRFADQSVAGFISKPYQIAALASVLRRVLAGH